MWLLAGARVIRELLLGELPQKQSHILGAEAALLDEPLTELANPLKGTLVRTVVVLALGRALFLRSQLAKAQCINSLLSWRKKRACLH